MAARSQHPSVPPPGSSLLALERKSIPIVAWYMLSKESYMKRVMSDVLPTASGLARRDRGFAAWGVGGLSHTALFAEENESGGVVSMARATAS